MSDIAVQIANAPVEMRSDQVGTGGKKSAGFIKDEDAERRRGEREQFKREMTRATGPGDDRERWPKVAKFAMDRECGGPVAGAPGFYGQIRIGGTRVSKARFEIAAICRNDRNDPGPISADKTPEKRSHQG